MGSDFYTILGGGGNPRNLVYQGAYEIEGPLVWALLAVIHFWGVLGNNVNSTPSYS